jgi:hypothetical protein
MNDGEGIITLVRLQDQYIIVHVAHRFECNAG